MVATNALGKTYSDPVDIDVVYIGEGTGGRGGGVFIISPQGLKKAAPQLLGSTLRYTVANALGV